MLKRANETKKSSQMSPPVLRSAAPMEPIRLGWNMDPLQMAACGPTRQRNAKKNNDTSVTHSIFVLSTVQSTVQCIAITEYYRILLQERPLDNHWNMVVGYGDRGSIPLLWLLCRQSITSQTKKRPPREQRPGRP
jgi:hypothetical protein